MEINNALQANVYSLRQAIGTVMVRKAVNQDSVSVALLLQGMQDANVKTLENSVTPFKGGNIDIRI